MGELTTSGMRPAGLPLPSALIAARGKSGEREYEAQAQRFLRSLRYRDYGWVGDKRVRDTGVWDPHGGFNGGARYNGTHPAVVTFYSPEVFCWLRARRAGVEATIPDGAMIIKEMYPAPAKQWRDYMRDYGLTVDGIEPYNWTVMIKDAAGSRDGWFWLSVFDELVEVTHDNIDALRAGLAAKDQALYRDELAELTALDVGTTNVAGHTAPKTPVLRDDEPSFVRCNMQPVDAKHPLLYPEASFGAYCVRCHSLAKEEHTFASLDNIEYWDGPLGRETYGEPLEFNADADAPGSSYRHATLSAIDGCRFPDPVHDEGIPSASDLVLEGCGFPAEPTAGQQTLATQHATSAPRSPMADVIPAYDEIARMSHDQALALKLPSESYDRVVAAPAGRPGRRFLTSDQCMSCHFGDASPYGPNMLIPGAGAGGKGVDVSPHGEWRWSMMGLAGRDPIFYAQLESERNIHPNAADAIAHTCLRCHGAMGQRQFCIDQTGAECGPQHAGPFYDERLAFLDPEAATGDQQREVEYGALSRDGISCVLCHQMNSPDELDFEDPATEFYTGLFTSIRPENGEHELLGPYDKPVEYAMKNALGVKPVQSDFLSSSELCASCHSVYLPVLDKKDGAVRGHGFEQATYLEWVNSDFYINREKGVAGPDARSCQDCHMSNTYVDPVTGAETKLDGWFKVANIQDQDFPRGLDDGPIAHGMVGSDDYTVEPRDGVHPDGSPEGYSRHTLAGVNLFALSMFDQFEEILGVRRQNYMNYLFNVENSIAEMSRQARRDSAELSIVDGPRRDGDELVVRIAVVNKTGHRLPSGVGFRRAFLHLEVTDAAGAPLWGSGRSNAAGVIVGPDGAPLTSEFATRRGEHEPHHQVIRDQRQVQIYEERVSDEDDELTTSFLSIHHHDKDNRLLPRGWRRDGRPAAELSAIVRPEYLTEWTRPRGAAERDADFTGGSDTIEYRIPLRQIPGAERVQARLFYQSIPPHYLRQRALHGKVEGAMGPHTRRLLYLVTRLQVEGTPIDGWKLELASTEAVIAAASP